MANEVDSVIVIREFEIQSPYYVHFRTNTFGKGINPPFPLAMGYIVPLLSFYEDSFGIRFPTKVFNSD